MIILAAGVGALVLVIIWAWLDARRERRWRERNEARMTAAAERRAQSDGHPRTGHVTHLGPHR